MDSSLIPGVIGGLFSVFICLYISKRISHKSKNGQLKFGSLILVTFLGCLLFVLGCTYALLFTEVNYEQDLIYIIFIIVFFGIGAIYTFGEAFKVYGNFDNNSIEFNTPWTGTKKENWVDLKSASFNSLGNWYTLTFNSGAVIRISKLINGHGLILDILKSKGHDL